MAYDYIKHAITDRFDDGAAFEDVELTIALGREMGGRWMTVQVAAVCGLMAVVPGVGFLVDDVRNLVPSLFMIGIGGVLLYVAAYRAVERRSLVTNADRLWLVRGPLFVAKRELVAIHEIVGVSADHAPWSALAKLGPSRARTIDTYRTWTIALDTTGHRVVLPLRMRKEDAHALAGALRDGLEERKRRIAAKGGYRGGVA